MEDVLERAQALIAGYDQELARELPEGAEIFDAHVHLGNDIDGFSGVYEDLEAIRLEAAMPTARFVRLIGVPERTYRRWLAAATRGTAGERPVAGANTRPGRADRERIGGSLPGLGSSQDRDADARRWPPRAQLDRVAGAEAHRPGVAGRLPG